MLIQAPAGSGKSTLLAQTQFLLTEHRFRTAVLKPAEQKSDSAFLASVFAAIQKGCPDATGGIAEFEAGSAELADRIVRAAQRLEAPLYLLIDDFHAAASPAVIQLLTRLTYLDRTVPLHLVIVSRVDTGIPISNLRMSGDLLELGTADLRFSADEAVAMLSAWDVAIAPDQWRKFCRKVDGWAVALRLALVLLKDARLDVAGLMAFSGTQREMAGYLSELLFDGLGPEDRKLLFQAAAFETLRADLLAAVLGPDAAARLLGLTKSLALPLDPTASDNSGLRLHSIVREFLTVSAADSALDLSGLRQRASEFLSAQGEWRQALSYALRAGELTSAAQVAETAGGWRLLYRGEQGTARQFLELSGLDRADFARFPKTVLGLSIAAAKRGEIDFACDLMDHAETVLDRADAAIMTEHCLIGALLALYRDDEIPPDVVARLENSLSQTPPLDLVQIALTQNLLCFAHLQSGSFDPAIRFGRQSVASFRSSNSSFGAAHLPLHIGQSEFFLGRFTAAQSTLQRHADHCEATLGAHADLTLMSQALLLETQIEQCAVADPMPQITWAMSRLGESDTWFDPLAALLVSGVRFALAESAPQEAETLIEAAEDIARFRGYDRLSHLAGLLRVETLIHAGQPGEARFLADTLAESSGSALDRVVSIRGLPLVALNAELQCQSGETGRALESLDGLESGHFSAINVPRRIRLDLLRIAALMDQGDMQAAARHLERLALTQPVDQYRLPFRSAQAKLAPLIRASLAKAGDGSLVQRRLSAVAEALDPPVAENQRQAVHLTKGERSILRLLEQGQSNKGIARTLDISDNTVKFHVANIFRKLGVNTRTAAAARAREARLLQD